MRVLLVEDDVALSQAVCSYLSAKAFVVDAVPSLAMAGGALRAAQYAAVLLDLHLGDGDGDGLTLLPLLRSLADRPVELTFFILALETAMRMRECYTLDIGQVSLDKKTIHLDRSKNGDSREVPMSSTAVALVRKYIDRQGKAIRQREGRLFPLWNGDRSVLALDATTVAVSTLYAAVFRAAGVAGFHFHDLRHEATCRLYERTTLSDLLIARITGHRDLRMLKRYASLRGSELAARLW